jgi:hypothetical protein
MKNLLAIVVLLLIAVQLWAAPANAQPDPFLCAGLRADDCMPLPKYPVLTPRQRLEILTSGLVFQHRKLLDRMQEESLPICREPSMECRLKTEISEREIERMGTVIPIPPAGP